MVLLCCRCAALLDSSPPAVQFVASNRPNVVHFVLNTSYIIPEVRLCLKRVAFAFGFSVLVIVSHLVLLQLFVHCTVLISDQRLTSGSKSCNYDVTQLRWLCLRTSWFQVELQVTEVLLCQMGGPEWSQRGVRVL